MSIRIENQLIVPFGRSSCESHQRIRLAGSSTLETLIESETPCLCINRANRQPVTFDQLSEAFSFDALPDHDDPEDLLYAMCDLLRENCELQSSHEHLFLTLYFDRLKDQCIQPGGSAKDRYAARYRLRRSLMPIPQTHLYLSDLSRVISGERREECVKVDLAFWTGQRFIAVLFEGSGESERRDRETGLLRFWGMEVLTIGVEDIERGNVSGTLARICQLWNAPDTTV